MLESMRKDGCDYIIAIMSGSFTQRGDVAVYSKFSRTKTALANGADIVIELPCVWAVSSAQRFAQGGCDIIRALGCVDRLYFGSESGDIDLLQTAADATADVRVNTLTKELMGKGEYYPVALQKAVEKIFGGDIASTLSSPNNTLGIEYIKALKGSGIEVRTIKRTGVDHDSESTTDTIASASKIREMIFANENCDSFIPENSKELNSAFIEHGERALLLKLRELTLGELENIPDVTEGLNNRISAICREKYSVEEILCEIKTKRYTHARLRRILICALLGIKKEHHKNSVPYIRVLGFSSCGEHLLKSVYGKTSLPVIINVAKDIEKLSACAREIFDLDIKATDVRTIFEQSPTPCGKDFTNGIIKQ